MPSFECSFQFGGSQKSIVADLHAVLMYGVRNRCSRLGYAVVGIWRTCLSRPSALVSGGKASKARYSCYALEPLIGLLALHFPPSCGLIIIVHPRC
ncbi:hypothetical protein MCOR02_011177 [Pyricularia oryzae]|nr:hypothetical protein MCOR02_011177 [Pyricularia oryzae]KAI6282773.1 hypothetical protein MCOR26_002730 [Pyricularia oryzae]KAI6333370.1 hypothetical protein MCOR28_010493 [Pyricularia oryzae]KAI6364102.1 hypothetical protein MCOR31_007586 [Pyricularia oryzae]KAI6389797.1 hypothetical protein MCOR23_009910 [Pyricularia oryzae]